MAEPIALVTGGTKGLGRALSLALATRGYAVTALYAHDHAAAEALAALLAPTGRVLRHDLATAVPAPGAFGDVDLLINNAWSDFAPRPLHTITVGELDAMWQVGLRGAWTVTQAVLPGMVRRRRGTIVNVLSSAAEQEPRPKGFGAYLAVKAAVASFGESLAAEYGERGVRVLSLAPGVMATAMTARWPHAMLESLGPLTDPDEVAAQTVALIEGR
jgi:3-oxoacyl-[acyl-carrier protein] reductase